MQRDDRFCLLLVIGFSAFSTMPLFQPHFFASSDGLFHLYRLMEYDTLFRDGVFYPRWAPDFFFGMGLPLFNYYAPLTYYLAEIFRLIGAGYIDSLRLLAATSMALSGIGAYMYVRLFLAPLPSVLSAVVYMYAPYHLVNLYYRGDFAEYVAYTWFPYILWSVSVFLEKKGLLYLLVGVLSYSALILTHNLSALIFSGFMLFYGAAALVCAALSEERKLSSVPIGLVRLVVLGAFAWALTAFFWVPALLEKSLVSFDRLLFHFDYHKFFPTLTELFSTEVIHRYGVVFRTAEVYGYRLGLLQAIYMVLGIITLFVVFYRIHWRLRVEMVASLVVIGISFFFIFPVSTWAWEHLPLLNLTQFPWRFLAFVALPSALYAGFVAHQLSKRLDLVFLAIAIPLTVVSSTAAMFPIMSDVKEVDVSPRGSIEFELAYGAIGTSAAAEYLPLWVKERPATSPIALATVLGEDIPVASPRTAKEIEAHQVGRRAMMATYKVHASKAGRFVPFVLYFPGWIAFVDGKPVDIEIDDVTGLVSIEVPEGDHLVMLQFVETPLRQASDAISLIALFVLFVLVISKLRRCTFGLPRIYRVHFGREDLMKVVFLLVLMLVWLASKYAYEAMYSTTVPHRFPLIVNLDNKVLTEGYDLVVMPPADGRSPGTATRVVPGSVLRVNVFWRLIGGDKTERYKPFARLTNSFNQTWAYVQSATEYSLSGWVPREAIATSLDLVVPPATPPGIYQIEIGFEHVSSGRSLEVRRVQVVPVLPGERGGRIGPVVVSRAPGDLLVRATSLLRSSLLEPVNFGDVLRLLDVALTDGETLKTGRPGAPLARSRDETSWQVRAGEIVHLDLLWQAMRKPDLDLTITARLVSVGRQLWAVRDSQPADGTYPTSLWLEGEVVRDQLNLSIPADTPPGEYELQLEVVSPTGPLSIFDAGHVPVGPTYRIGKLQVTPALVPADVQSIAIEQRTNALVSRGLSIVGYSFGQKELQPGHELTLEIVWRAISTLGNDVSVRVEIIDQAGRVLAASIGRPVGDAFPTSLWREGEVLRGRYSLLLDASAQQGEAEVRVTILDADNGEVLGSVSLGKVHIQARLRRFTASPRFTLASDLGGQMRLLGFDVTTNNTEVAGLPLRAAPAETVDVTLYWQALQRMSTSYTVFVQVLNASGRLVAQHDSLPGGGESPTTAWIAGEVVADHHSVRIPPDLPAGDYTLITGVYEAVTGRRLPVEGDGDFIILAAIRVPGLESHRLGFFVPLN